MYTIIRYIMLTASRDLLFIGLLLGVLVAVALSAILGSTAMLEKEAMTLSFAASSARLMLMLGIAVFICFHVRQAFEHKEIEVLLSRPLSRQKIMLAYWVGFSLVASILVIASATVISFLPRFHVMGYFFWFASLLSEAWLLVAFALFAAFSLRSAVVAVMVTLGFYVLGRMMAFFLLTLENPSALIHVEVSQWAKGLLAGIAMIVPRLDLFAQSDWLVYGVADMHETQLVIWQSLVYIPLLLTAAMVDFLRKEF